MRVAIWRSPPLSWKPCVEPLRTSWSRVPSAVASWFGEPPHHDDPVLIWFAAGAVVIAFVVFRSPALDYRLVALGAVIPVIETPFGPGPLHALIAPTVVLAAVMLATSHRRLLRRQWLGLPIGMYLHLVLDAAFTNRETFWWPFFGLSFGEGDAPELARGWWALVLELAGIAMAVWAYRRFGLDDPHRRSVFLRTGQLDRRIVGPEGTGS